MERTGKERGQKRDRTGKGRGQEKRTERKEERIGQ